MMTADSSWMPCTSQPSSTSLASSFCARGRPAPRQPAWLWPPPGHPRRARPPEVGAGRAAAARNTGGYAEQSADGCGDADSDGGRREAAQRLAQRTTRPGLRRRARRTAAAAAAAGAGRGRRARLLGQRQDEAAEAANLAALQPDVVAGRPEADHAAVAGRLHRAQRQALQAHPARVIRLPLPGNCAAPGVSRAGGAPGPRRPPALRGSRPAQEAPNWHGGQPRCTWQPDCPGR